jgi:hypothetical protein
MALKIQYKKKLHGVTFRSGHIYSFKYQAWQNDPKPTIIFMYAFAGTHPSTGRQWRFIQAINFTYVPRSMRKAFANEWINIFERSNGNVKFTWNKVKSKYPYLKHAIRRYFYTPGYYISDLNHIPFENMEEVIVSTWSKDFSKKLKVSLFSKFSKALKNRRKITKQAKKSKRGFFGRRR